jgi:hypothetical protein
VDASLTVGEVAERLGIGGGAVYFLLFFGLLAPAPAADGVRVGQASLDEYLARAAGAEGRWDRLRLDEKVVDVLTGASAAGHHFGTPWLTAHQVALGVRERHPAVFEALGRPVAAGDGSLPAYLSAGLSRRIRERGDRYPVQGAFLSTAFLDAVTLVPAEQPAATYDRDLVLFRLRSRR